MSDAVEELRRYLASVAPEGGSGLEGMFEGGLEAAGPSPLDQLEDARKALKQNFAPSAAQMGGLEAIILPRLRPVVNVLNDKFADVPAPFVHLGGPAHRSVIERAIPSIGRIEVPGHPSVPYGGTGFVVGPGLLMTNRHVASLFSTGLGTQGLSFKPGIGAGIDFAREHESDRSVPFDVAQLEMIHPHWDMALLQVRGPLEDRPPLWLHVGDPDALEGREVVVIGYPAFDPRNNVAVQHQVFRSTYNVKRLQPGKVMGRAQTESYGRLVNALTHDSSTLGGNSGSAVIDVKSGHVLGLHFAGRYLAANYAVPAAELARDPAIVRAGVRFSAASGLGRPAWERVEDSTRVATSAVAASSVATSAAPAKAATSTRTTLGSRSVVVEVPLRIEISLGDLTLGDGQPSSSAEIESVRDLRIEIDTDYSNRRGYSPDFLGSGDREVRIPWLSPASYAEVAHKREPSYGTRSHVLDYHHFSVVMNKRRRLAFFTAANIHGRKEVQIKRERFSDAWYFDDRIERREQLGNVLYASNPLDRGHLVRRLDATWGNSFEEAKAAHDDTFHWTNCSPQHLGFNRLGGIWARIEDYILNHANDGNRKITVFTGPVFRNDDPVHRGVKIPRSYWKVVAIVIAGRLWSGAFRLWQSEQLSDAGIESFLNDTAWSAEQLPVRDLEDLVGMTFHGLSSRDAFTGGDEESTGGARLITCPEDVELS